MLQIDIFWYVIIFITTSENVCECDNMQDNYVCISNEQQRQ